MAMAIPEHERVRYIFDEQESYEHCRVVDMMPEGLDEKIKKQEELLKLIEEHKKKAGYV